MNNYEILGLSEDASLDEIKEAYENKIAKINEEVVNEKHAQAFRKVIEDAYRELTIINVNKEETLVMSKEEFYKILDEENNNYDDYYEDDYSDEESYENDYKKSRRRERRTSKNKRNKKSRARREEERLRDKEINYEDSDDEIDLPWYVAFPLKVVVLPLIIILTIIIMILDVLNAALWAVTKILIIGAVAVAAIHGYQIYSGISLVKYEVFACCAGVFIISIILPLIFKTIPKPLKIMNNKLKAFVF